MTYGHREAIILITVEECTPILQKFLKESRYRHSLAVSEQAVSLALLYGADVEKARIAGLLHDLAKNLSEKQCLQWGKELHVSFDEITRRLPSLWHAVLSEAYVREKLGICDPEVLWAIRYHTTGRAGMCLLEKVVYLADYTSVDRTFPDAEVLRKTVCQDLNEAMRIALEFTICRLVREKKPVHPDSVSAYNELV